jgi:ATP-dependent DNA helicase RecQ
VLALTPAARPVLRGQERVLLREERARPAVARKARRAAAAAPIAPGSLEERVFERLRALRREIAAAHGVPPYVVFHDTTLRAMAAARPATLGGLAALPGLGETKLDRYGERFLAAIREAGAEG